MDWPVPTYPLIFLPGRFNSIELLPEKGDCVLKGATARTLGEELIVEYQSIPDHVRDELAATVLDCVRAYLQQPGSARKKTAVSVVKKGGRSN